MRDKGLAFKNGCGHNPWKDFKNYDFIDWPFKTCYSLNAYYTVIRLNDSLKRAMDILAVERR